MPPRSSPPVTLKLAIWTNIPNQYQQPFQQAVRNAGVDLVVRYYERVPAQRLKMGWSSFDSLPDGEKFVEPTLSSLYEIPDWKERIHVLPGYGKPFLVRLAAKLSASGCEWVHWSERAHPGFRWLVTYPLKRAYSELLNRYALGAFANGIKAVEDFAHWGIARERIAVLTYSTQGPQAGEVADPDCVRFRGSGRAFITLGTLCARKGTDVLLRAFARATEQAPTWKLILVGDDSSNGEYAQLAAGLGVADRVLFRGPITATSVGTAIAAADVLIQPSRFDGWAVTLNEGSSRGLPLIATEACGATDHLIESGKNGLCARSGDAASLAAAMGAYVQDDSLVARHGAHSRLLYARYAPAANAQHVVETLTMWRALQGAVMIERAGANA